MPVLQQVLEHLVHRVTIGQPAVDGSRINSARQIQPPDRIVSKILSTLDFSSPVIMSVPCYEAPWGRPTKYVT